MWFHKSSEADDADENANQLDPKDYNIYINPILKAETEVIIVKYLKINLYSKKSINGSIALLLLD